MLSKLTIPRSICLRMLSSANNFMNVHNLPINQGILDDIMNTIKTRSGGTVCEGSNSLASSKQGLFLSAVNGQVIQI